jgi:excisionase family DNA binding protein
VDAPSTTDGVGVGWLSTAEAARAMGVTQRTVCTFIDDGTLPAVRAGRRWRVHQADVDAYLEAHRVQPGSLAHLHEPRVLKRRVAPP